MSQNVFIIIITLLTTTSTSSSLPSRSSIIFLTSCSLSFLPATGVAGEAGVGKHVEQEDEQKGDRETKSRHLKGEEMEKYEEEEEKWMEYLEKGEKGYLQLQADSSDRTAEYRGPFYTNPAE